MTMATHQAPDRGDDLSRFRYHTGATLRRLAPDEPCRLLFRDIGPAAMAFFLRGRLQRLAGPYAPILYTRTADYREPHVDYEPVGRLIFLRPMLLRPWYSGVPTIFVASLRQRVDPQSVGFVPAHLDLHAAETLLRGVDDVGALREALGGREYDQVIHETLVALDRVNTEHAETEKQAEPVRRKLQSRQRAEVEWAKAWLTEHVLTESDLCTAWHHLPRPRRDHVRAAVQELGKEARPC
jgi:hypothetical protein